MADINSSLIGYLKKKSLFTTSPMKNKEQRSLSRDGKNFDQSQKSHKKISYNPENRNIEPEFTYPTKNLNKHNSTQQFVDFNLDSVSQVSHPIETPSPRYQRNSPQEQKQKLTKRQFKFEQKQ